MSYARLSEDSDVYVFRGSNGQLHCHWCALGLDDDTGLNAQQMAQHLELHAAAGDKVPAMPALEGKP